MRRLPGPRGGTGAAVPGAGPVMRAAGRHEGPAEGYRQRMSSVLPQRPPRVRLPRVDRWTEDGFRFLEETQVQRVTQGLNKLRLS